MKSLPSRNIKVNILSALWVCFSNVTWFPKQPSPFPYSFKKGFYLQNPINSVMTMQISLLDSLTLTLCWTSSENLVSSVFRMKGLGNENKATGSSYNNFTPKPQWKGPPWDWRTIKKCAQDCYTNSGTIVDIISVVG